MESFSKSFDPTPIEKKWYSFWEEGGFFKPASQSEKGPFSIVIPPPNVTGVLHMGHALVDTLQDILIRWKRMQGFETLWVPGTDHAGIATQTVVEKHLFSLYKKRRKDFTREDFLQHIWNWKEKSETQILNQLKRLGCSCDWSRLRFTMDEGCNLAVQTAFKKMFDEKLIYQGDYLVNWDPVTQTALSDDEVEHEERDSFLWFIRYPIQGTDQSITIATTRPETMLGDTAVAVHPEDERYASFIGKKIKLPLSEREIPILADPFVDPSFGTGAVKITPAHDFNDFEVGRRHDLPFINILTPDGKINENGGAFSGCSVEEARKKVALKLKTEGFLERKEPHKLRVGLSYRSKAILEPYLSKQWFVNMRHFKEKLLSAVREKRVTLIPSYWEDTYNHWIENIRDWCISRQIWWGHRIPIWYNKEDPEKMICHAGEDLPLEVKKNPGDWVQETDVLDTWFSSALWPFSALGWPHKTEELKKFYPTSTLITGHDILFFWVARMILMGEYIQDEVPFHESFLHGLIYGKSYWKKEEEGHVHYLSPDEKKKYDLGEMPPVGIESKWEKMSKSKGNIIDPLEVIDEYGTDALRIALTSSVTHARQIDLDRRRFEEYKNFANKVWNGARFVFMNLEDLSSKTFSEGLDRSLFRLEDFWIFSLMNRTIQEINHHLENYSFDKAALRAYEFFWNDFCAVYVELAKPILFKKEGDEALRVNKQKLLVILLLNALRLLHPITPFITEELFSRLKEKFSDLKAVDKSDTYTQDAVKALLAPACIVAPYPQVLNREDINPKTEEVFSFVYSLVRSIRNLRTEMQIPPSEKTDLYIYSKENTENLFKQKAILLSLTQTKEIFFVDEEPTCLSSTTLVGAFKLIIPIPESLKLKEKIRLEKEKEKVSKLLDATKIKLSNQEFREKAPKQLVEKLEKNLEETKAQFNEISKKLESY